MSESMSCDSFTSCGDCLADQWDLPTNALNFTSGDNCQWCLETSTCVTLQNVSTCSGSSLVNFEKQICLELTCALNRISTSPYICSQYGIVIFCLTIVAALLTGFVVFSWFRSSKAKNMRCKMNSGARGDYKRCRECGETSQNANFLCKACDRHDNYFGLAFTGAISFLLGLWYTIVAPMFVPFSILLVGTGFAALVSIMKIFRNTSLQAEEQKLLSSQYLIVEEDVEANEKFTFGLDDIKTNQLRYSIAKEISRENQAVNFVLETTQQLDFVVTMTRFMLVFYVWISAGLILSIILMGWGPVSRIIFPIAVLLPALGFVTPMKNRKQAIVITSKNIIIAQEALRKVRVSSTKFTDVKEIKITKTEGFDQYGQLVIHKNDNTRQTVFQLWSVADFEAALIHSQFEGKPEAKTGPKLARNWCTKNFFTIIMGFSLLFSLGLGVYMIVMSFLHGFNWVSFWCGIGMFGVSYMYFTMRKSLMLMNPFLRDVFVYIRRT